MIGLIIDILNKDDYYGVSETVDIAKGVNELPTSFNKAWKQRKRKRAWLQR